MNSAQWRGIIVLIIGFLMTAVAGTILATMSVNWALPRLILTTAIVFAAILPIFIYGIWVYARNTNPASPAEEMTKPRQLLNLLRSVGQADMQTLAQQLDASPQEIKDYVDDLSRLDLFCGIVNWEERVIALTEPAILRKMTRCSHCKTPLTIAQNRSTVCPTCSTEYHLPDTNP